MDHSLSDEQVAIATMVRDLMTNEVGPRTQEIDEQGVFPTWVADLFRKHDLFAVTVPEDYGGIDGRLLTHCLVVEQVGRVCASCSMILGAQSLGAGPITLFGSADQKERWLTRLATGEVLVAFGLTEPNAGSDAKAMTTRAVPTDGGWRLNGRKSFITHANVADVIIVFAKVKADGADQITAFLVETDRAGFTVDKIEHKMGLRGSPTCSFVLEDVWIPQANMLGELGQGLEIMLRGLHRGRIGSAAQSVGLGQGALDIAAAYATQREQFGRPLARMQAVQTIVGQMATEIEAARQLVYSAACRYDARAADIERFSSMAKLFASDATMRVTGDAVQIMGGYGYMVEYGVERMMRDAKVFQIFEGANQIQQITVARDVFAKA
ncbi:MAG: acyl-CoA dehydrogenase family protein [Thermoleophilia bacterium]|nr:acyl-CoA dehydrogenase family protein [Thermoleophilia bacterium]